MRILICLSFVVSLLGQVPSSKEALSMQKPMDAAISPDGKYVAYVLSRTNWEDNSNESDLYLAEVGTTKSLKLTASRKSSSAPAWSTDSKQIAFLSNREGKQQIYLIPVGGGEAMQLTDHETGVSSFEWGDASQLYFLAGDAETSASKDRKKQYGELTVVDEEYTMSHVWRVKITDSPKQKAERLTEGPFTVMSLVVARTGLQVAIVTKKNPDLSTLGAKLQILDPATKALRVLAGTRNQFGRISWSPNSKEIAYTTQGEVEGSYFANAHIEVRPVDGGAARKVSGSVDEQLILVDWTSRGIYFLARNKTSMNAYIANPSSDSPRELSLPSGWTMNSVSLTKSLDKVAFIGASTNQNFEVYVTPGTSWAPQAVSNLKTQWAKFQPAKREVVSWKSKDGATIEGILLTPQNFDRSKKHPLLVIIHGGPTGIDLPYVTPDSYYPAEQFVAKGGLVLRPNYRGSSGYGAKFRALNVGNLGVGDAWDVLSGIDHLIGQGFVDGARVGSMGWSQGGYISAFLATAHADRFKALSVGAGISNWVTYYVNTDIHPFTRQYLKATPWDDMEVYRKTSPMTYIKQAKSPVLIQHGDNDKRVPPQNAFELYQGLKDVGVPSRLVLYKGFGHGINKPKEAMHVMDENLSWFSRYVFGEAAN